eukprot:517557-Pelagomonas_calceolata.AAC.1
MCCELSAKGRKGKGYIAVPAYVGSFTEAKPCLLNGRESCAKDPCLPMSRAVRHRCTSSAQ